MDDKSTQLLQEILNQQKQQTDLLRKYLWRLRFSLLDLMLLVTLVGVALGIGVYVTRLDAPYVISAGSTSNRPYQTSFVELDESTPQQPTMEDNK